MVLQGLQAAATRVVDVNLLRLPADVTSEVVDIIHDNRMEWEPWVESADTYEELRQKLVSRGYSQLPLKASPLHSASSHNNPHVADLRTVGTQKTMVRKAT
jgi:hypothetical protein